MPTSSLVLFGAGYGFAAAVQPGPLQAFLLARVLARGWRRTLPAALSPLLSDGPIALVTLLVLGALPPPYQRGLRVVGGVFLLYLAWTAWFSARRAEGEADRRAGGGMQTLWQAALVNLLNPNPYLGWALVLGPTAVTAWRRHPVDAVAYLAAFYLTIVAVLAAFIVLCERAARLRRGRALLLRASAVALALLGIWQWVAAAG